MLGPAETRTEAGCTEAPNGPRVTSTPFRAGGRLAAGTGRARGGPRRRACVSGGRAMAHPLTRHVPWRRSAAAAGVILAILAVAPVSAGNNGTLKVLANGSPGRNAGQRARGRLRVLHRGLRPRSEPGRHADPLDAGRRWTGQPRRHQRARSRQRRRVRDRLLPECRDGPLQGGLLRQGRRSRSQGQVEGLQGDLRRGGGG